MTVYVDDMYTKPLGKFGRMKMSHMLADTEAELHAMADTIGVDRRWYQGNHYDVCMSKRTKAIEAGAVPITLREMGEKAFAQWQRNRAKAAAERISNADQP